jgi:hypothetical protein
MVMKKHLTPIGKGGITKHAGKGSSAQAVPPGQMQTLTPGAPLDRTMNTYAKATPMAGPLPPTGMPTASPMGGSPPDLSGGGM